MHIDAKGNFVFDSDRDAREHAQAAVDVLEAAPNLAEGDGTFLCPRESWQLVMNAGSAIYGADLEQIMTLAGTGDRLYCLLNLAAHLLAAAVVTFEVCAPPRTETSAQAWKPAMFADLGSDPSA